MRNTRKTISVPKDELLDLKLAKEKIARAYGEIMISDSQAFRVGIQAILELDLRRLEMCVERCPQLTPGRESNKEREQMTGDEIKDFLDL